MRYKIVSDSSSDVLFLEEIDFASVPLKIITEEKEYTDDASLDVKAMVSALEAAKSSSTSCPNAFDWLSAFEGGDRIFVLTITGSLSGSYQGACAAAEEYRERHPHVEVYVMDTLSTGPEMRLLIEKLRELILAGKEFNEIIRRIKEYHCHTHLLFSLESLHNLAQNGRVNPAVAKVAKVLGIRIVGMASEHGTLEPLHKCRGEKRARNAVFSEMEKHGFCGGKVHIAHCFNEAAAKELREQILARYPQSMVVIRQCAGLCSYYAERGGLLVGFEG